MLTLKLLSKCSPVHKNMVVYKLVGSPAGPVDLQEEKIWKGPNCGLGGRLNAPLPKKKTDKESVQKLCLFFFYGGHCGYILTELDTLVIGIQVTNDLLLQNPNTSTTGNTLWSIVQVLNHLP